MLDPAEALAAAEHQYLNAVRWGSPVVLFAAHNAQARALIAARTAQAEADYATDPEGFYAHLRHDAACAGEHFYNS